MNLRLCVTSIQRTFNFNLIRDTCRYEDCKEVVSSKELSRRRHGHNVLPSVVKNVRFRRSIVSRREGENGSDKSLRLITTSMQRDLPHSHDVRGFVNFSFYGYHVVRDSG